MERVSSLFSWNRLKSRVNVWLWTPLIPRSCRGSHTFYRLYRLDLERTLAGAAFRHHRYVIHQYRGPHQSGLLVNVHTIDPQSGTPLTTLLD